MIRSFRHKGLQTFFVSGRVTGIRPEQADRIPLILGRLAVAEEARDMALPRLRLHSLKGRLKGYSAMNVSGNWRIVFRFAGKDVIDVDYLDYH